MTTTVLSLSGDFDIYRKAELESLLLPLEEFDRAILDLSGVRYIDAAAIGCLVALRNHMLTAGRKGIICIRGASPQVEQVLHVCGLDAVFEVEPSRARPSAITSESDWNTTETGDRDFAS